MVEIRDDAGRKLYTLDEDNKKIDITKYNNSELSKDYTYQIVCIIIIFALVLSFIITFIIS